MLPRTQCGSEISSGDIEILSISATQISLKLKANIGCFLMTGEKQQDILIDSMDRYTEIKWNDISLKKL
ncbi:hypothetical protein D3C87_1948380 [compost metagenome]